jgi:hypothetical protein
METCKTAERNLTLKGFISLWKDIKAIKCTNCHLSFRCYKRFLGGAIVGMEHLLEELLC